MIEGAHLIMEIGDLTLDFAPQSVVEALVDLQVNESSGTQRSGFQFKLQYDVESEIGRDLLPTGFFDAPRRVKFTLLMHGSTHTLIDGIITRQDITQSSTPGQSSLTVTGMDLTQVMDQIDLTGVPMPAMPTFAQVNVILAPYMVYGIVPTVIPTVQLANFNPAKSVPARQGTDYAHVTRLASEAGYVFYIYHDDNQGENVAYWGPEVQLGEVQKSLSVNMDTDSNVDSISFGYDGISKPLYTLMHKDDDVSGLTIPIPLPGVNPLSPPLGPELIAPRKFVQINHKERKTEDDDAMAKSSLPEVIMRGLSKAARGANVVNASGSLDVLRYGGLLRARHLVGVRGAGDRYNGFYYVDKTTTTLKPGSIQQSFSLKRNAHGAFPGSVAA
ncbi:MAG: hypothetical protein ACRBDL_07075 [Alphaproteobacteria bacterium]